MNTDHFKKRLEEELSLVESELKDVAFLNEETGEWEPKEDDMESMSPLADPNEAADKQEEFEEHAQELPALTYRWAEVKHALEKIDTGTYGKCEVSGEPIEEDRLEANPAARTCKAHK